MNDEPSRAGRARTASPWLRDVVEGLLPIVPAPLLRVLLPRIRTLLEFEISAEAMRAALDRLPAGGNLLVFSLGRDSRTWEAVNRGGRTAFIEDLEEWVDLSRSRWPRREVHKVRYTTELTTSLRLANASDIPLPTVPESVWRSRWDIVVVDGPKGYAPGQPGRASSIALAERLVAPWGIVLIDDYDRPLERKIARLVFGREADLMMDESRPFAVFMSQSGPRAH